MKRTRYLTGESLRTAPELIGQPLASPVRRFFAMAADYVILFIPSLAVALAAALISLWLTEPAALRAIRAIYLGGEHDPNALRQAYREIAPLMVRLEMPGVPPAVELAVEEGDLDRAAEILSGYDLMVALAIGEREEVNSSPKTVVFQLEKVIPKYGRTVAMWGVGALYFTLLTRSKRGATLGKRLLGIRVVHLSGERLGLLDSLERFAGYLEIPATLGFVLVNLWHDPNRRLPHDKLANTAVLRVVKEPKTREKSPSRPEAADAETGAGGSGGESTPQEGEKGSPTREEECSQT